MKVANDALSFALELAALAALAVWAFSVGDDLAVHSLLAVGAVGAFVAVWAAWLAPRSPRRLAGPALLSAEVLIFGLATVALAAADHEQLAIAFAALVVLNLGVTARWGSALGPSP